MIEGPFIRTSQSIAERVASRFMIARKFVYTDFLVHVKFEYATCYQDVLIVKIKCPHQSSVVPLA